MQNLILFLVPVIFYFVFSLVYRPGQKNFKKNLYKTALLAFLFCPFNFSGYVVTLFGNGYGEKGFYSLCSLYQKSGGDTVTIVSPFTYQEGSSVFQGIGICIQNADVARHFFGLSWQNAKEGAYSIIGLAIVQKSEGSLWSPLSVYQAVPNKERWFGVSSGLEAIDLVVKK